MAIALPHLGPRTRKVLRIVGYIALALVTFVLAFQATFPFDRVKDKISEALAEKYDVTIGSVEGGWIPGRVYFKAVTLRPRPTKADEVASTLYVEQLRVDLGLLALLRGAAVVGLEAKIGPGQISGEIQLSSSGTVVALTGDDLPAMSLPVREAIGLPMSAGKLRFALDLDLPNEKGKTGKVGPNWVKAKGQLELACPSGCVIGDGKTKLKPKIANPRQQAFAEGGIEFGKVNIDSLLAKVEVKDGKLGITKLETKSADGELHVDFNLTLHQDLMQSVVTGCLRFNVSPVLLKREPKTHTAISATGAPLGPDNLFHIKLDGPLREMRRVGVVCTQGTAKPGDGGTPRPNLTVTPDPAPAPTAPPGTVTIPPPPPLQPVPPPAAEGAGSAIPPLQPPSGPQPGGASPPSAPPGGAPPPAAPPPAAPPS